MKKTRIFVREVLDASEQYDVVFADLYDGDVVRNVQICMSKRCQMSSLTGKEVYYEVKDGSVCVSQVNCSKQEEDTNAAESDCPKE